MRCGEPLSGRGRGHAGLASGFGAAAAVGMLAALLPRLALAWEVGVAPATRKILPDTPTPGSARAELEAARNEWEAFQIVIRDADGAAGVNVEVSDLCAEHGTCLSASHARLYREYYVEVTQASPFGVTRHEREPGLYPDPLVPFGDPYAIEDRPIGAPFDLAADDTGTVFVDWYVPLGTAPGTYEGTATVTASNGRETELSMILTVWEFDIPLQKTVATAFKLVEGGSGVRSYHGGPRDETRDDLDAIVDNYHLALHEHRLDPTIVNGPMSFEFAADGNLLPVDWTEYDAAVRPWLDGSRFPDGVGVTRFDVHRFRPGKGLGGMTESEYVQTAAAIAEHLNEMGWWDRAYVYAHDEPWNPKFDTESVFAQIDQDAELLLGASDLWRNKTLITGPWDERIADEVGIWCPDTTMYDDWFSFWAPHAGWDTYTEHLDAGGELWFYVCRLELPPYAGYDIDTAIGYEPRIVSWGAWFERGSGLLYWCVNCWLESDPWHVFGLFDEESDARNGNGFLLYPGDHDGTRQPRGSPDEIAIDGPILSYRLKQIRDGLEDWEMFRLATELGAEAFTREQVRRAYQRFGIFGPIESCDDPKTYCPDEQPWTLDENVLLDARRMVGQKIQFLLHPEKHPDPEAVPEVPGASRGCGGCRTGEPPAAWPLVLGGTVLVRRCRRRRSAATHDCQSRVKTLQ